MQPGTANTYDDLPYIGHAFRFTHPDQLAVMGTLHGLRPAPVERCRVLEIGCGDGANLLPMAYTLPESTFFGIDLAARPIDAGKAQSTALGLSNLSLQAMDILEFPAEAGPFDYIIAHGIFSWVPPAVQDKVLAICGEQLAPQGIAYISYKTYPGSHVSAMLHEMMRYQASLRPNAPGKEIVRAGLEMLRLVVHSKPEPDPFRAQLSWQLKAIEERLKIDGGDAMTYHDIGVEISQPSYFYEFVARAEQNGLQFLSEVMLERANDSQFTPATNQFLDTLEGDVIAQEQYKDFLGFQEFRRTLLCRKEIVVDHTVGPERIHPLYVASSIKSAVAQGSTESPQGEEAFVAARGTKITVDRPVLKAAFRRLGAVWPGAIAFDELFAASAPAYGPADISAREDDALCLATTLLELYRADLAELTTRQLKMATAPSEFPVASARVRQQIDCGGHFVTDLLHTEIKINEDYLRKLLTLLDGTRDRASILRDFQAWLEEARVMTPALPTPEWAAEKIDVILASFVRQGLLVA